MPNDNDLISDEEFVRQLVERVKKTGHRLIFIDRGLMRFGKIAGFFLTMFVLFGLALFGFDVQKATTQVRDLRREVGEARDQLSEDKRDFDDKARELEVAQEDAIKSVKSVEALTRETLRSAALTLAEFVATNVGDDPEGQTALEHFYRETLELADKSDLPLLKSEILRRIAFFYWNSSDRQAARHSYEEAVALAVAKAREEEGEAGDADLAAFSKKLAADIYLEHANNEIASAEENSRVASANASRLLKQALPFLEGLGDNQGMANTLRLQAQILRLSGQADTSEYIEKLERARELYAATSAIESDRTRGGELDVLKSLARIYTDTGEVERALNVYAEAVGIAADIERFTVARIMLLKMASLEMDEGERIDLICRAIEFNRKSTPPTSDERLTQIIGRIQKGFDAAESCKEGDTL